jgi:predicted ATPase
LPWGAALRGWALAEQGQAEEGIAQLRQAIADWRAAGSRALVPYFLGLLAEAYARMGRADEGLITLAEALAITEQTHEADAEAQIPRLKGELLLIRAAQEEQEAEACFRQAIEIARRQRAKSLELRAVMSLSRLWQRQNKQAEARQMLAEVYGWFTEGFDTADLKEAKSLLDRLS